MIKQCCNDMEKVINNSSVIDYDPILRCYCINVTPQSVKQILICPWCGTKFKTNLNKKIFEILRNEYKIEVPDLTNFTNIPEEFKTDEWWKKRGL